jgi:hypothetical protein
MVIRNKVRLAPEVDICGEGGYFVAPPSIHASIHASGHVYRWEFRMNGWDDLAVYAPPDPHREQTGNLNLNLESVKTSPILQPVPEGQRNQTLAQLAGRWAAKGLDLEEAILLAKAWNENNMPPLGWTELERTVQSIFETHLRNHPVLPEITDIECEISEPEKQETPEAILGPGGILQDIMEYYKNNSSSSFTLFDLAGAITTVGAVAGQKVMTETGLRTNFYCVSIGWVRFREKCSHCHDSQPFDQHIGSRHPRAERNHLPFINPVGSQEEARLAHAL